MKMMKGWIALAGLAVVAQSQAVLLIDERFNYSNGSLTTVAPGIWANHSGTAGQVDVQASAVNLTETESEDVNRTFTPQGSGTIFAGLDVKFSALPSGTGGYFFHFKDTTVSNFKGRVFALPGSSSTKVKIGITNGANTVTAIVANELTLGLAYRIILSTAVATMFSSVEVVGLGSATAGDGTAAVPLSSIAFRQSLSASNGMGTLKVDNLVVGTSRAEAAVPEPGSLVVLAAAAGIFVARRRKA